MAKSWCACLLACFASVFQAASSDKRERFYGARACRLVVELELCLRKTLAIAIMLQIAFAGLPLPRVPALLVGTIDTTHH